MSPPRFETLLVEAGKRVGTLTLNRPERLNALGATMLGELAAAAAWFGSQTEARVVIVAGAGRAFSAGADLRDSPAARLDPASGESWEARREVAQLGYRMAEAIEAMPQVTIAAVHGHVVGGGVVLTAACDLRIAAEGTSFSIPEVDIGIPLAWGGIPRLVREIGPARAKELVMTCRPFDAAEAKDIGFVNRLVPESDLAAAAAQLAEELAAKPIVPMRTTKEHVNAVARAMSAADLSSSDADKLLAALASPESRAAAAAYVKRVFGG